MSDENKSQKYPSTEIILNTCVIEYEKEAQRTSSIDAKTNIFLTISTALYAFFIPLANLSNIFARENTLFNTVAITLLIILAILSFLSLLTSTILFISVISSRKYQAIETFDILPYADKPAEKTSVVLSRLYDKAVRYNKQTNEKRMKWFKSGVISIVICIILITFTYIFKVNFL